MKYLSVSEVAKEWGVSSAQIRKYCREGRIPGAFTENNAWYVPETAVKPTRKETAEQEKEVLFPIAKRVSKTSWTPSEIWDNLPNIIEPSTQTE